MDQYTGETPPRQPGRTLALHLQIGQESYIVEPKRIHSRFCH